MSRQQKRATKRMEEKLKISEYTLKFSQQELIAIYNILGSNPDGSPREYRIGDAVIVFGIIEKIKPLVVVSTNIPPNKQADPEPVVPVVIGVEADAPVEEKETN